MTENEGLLSVEATVSQLWELPADVVAAAYQAFYFSRLEAIEAALANPEVAKVAYSLAHCLNGHYEYVVLCMAEPWNVSVIGPGKLRYASGGHLSLGL